ncbi:MAG: serine hydroxymethyltransferase [Rhodobiaceae bacterium]|nr:serine hydroxymethyltransferase [Rhodobiaceae bacterium]RPF96691.1 MAG: serine hydroxymethyltransferase [Rhizobiales bacterium TMED227]|tara:strand:- start:1450 stop:2727 length:1278 start_codon:yes stop_codon:yes gene_type:complete
MTKDFFTAPLSQIDPEVFQSIGKEVDRQKFGIELIASENIVSKAVLDAQGSILTNKYAEGYPNKRYYGGCMFVDETEQLAIDRAKELFNCDYANVQAHSGSQANQAVMLALLKPGDTFMGMTLAAGGHLTHGAAPNLSGKWFNAIGYGVRKEDALIDYDELYQKAREHKPKLIIAGGSAYPRIIDFNKFREICDEVGACLLVDMAHFSGLVAGGAYPSPFPYADIVTSTTHKVLRGPRGGLTLTNNEDIAKKVNSAIFPGLQGGPLCHIIAAKAVAFKEALSDSFKDYASQVVKNSIVLADTIQKRGFDIVSGGTETHLSLIDLRPKGLTGKLAEKSLENAGITCNKNGIPFDPESPFITSGIRLGTPAATSRGFKEDEFVLVGNLIGDVLDSLANNKEDNSLVEKEVHQKVTEICNNFPIYSFL